MERKLNNKLQLWCKKFKADVIGEIQKIYLNDQSDNDLLNEKNKQVLDLIQMIYDYENIKINTSDLQKRKRVKNVVPFHERCCALRANAQQCTRRKKNSEKFCGTHIKGIPHGEISANDNNTASKSNIKKEVWAQDIAGIIYYIDSENNVYDHNDIVNNIVNPKIIAK